MTGPATSRALLALRVRQWRAAAAYWLGVVGFESGPGLGGRLYAVYFWLIAVGWLAYAWVDMLQIGVLGGASGPLDAALARALPTAIGLLQAALMALFMGSAAVRLSWPDRSWLVTLPLPALAFVADGWAALVRPAIVGGLLAASVLAASMDHGIATVLAVMVPAVAIVLASVSLGLLPAAVARAGSRRRPALAWLMPAVWVALVVTLPAARGPGRALVAVAAGGALAPWLPTLAAWVAGTALLLILAGGRLNLTWAVEDSRAQAERQSVAWLSWSDPAAARAYLAERQMAVRRARGRMPGWGGLWALAARQWAAWLRRPQVALALVALGLKVWSGLWICLAPGTGLGWVPWLVVVLATGRGSLTALVWGGAKSPFVDQLLPWRDVRRLWAELALPGLTVTVAAVAAWLARPAAVGLWPALAIAPALAFLLLVAAAGDPAFRAWRGRLSPGLVASALVAMVLTVAAAWRSPALTAAAAVAGGIALAVWLEGADGDPPSAAPPP